MPVTSSAGQAYPSGAWARWKLAGDWLDSSGNGRNLATPALAAGFPQFVLSRDSRLVASVSGAGEVPSSPFAMPDPQPHVIIPVPTLETLVTAAHTVALWVRFSAFDRASTTSTIRQLFGWHTQTPAGGGSAGRVIGRLGMAKSGANWRLIWTSQAQSSSTALVANTTAREEVPFTPRLNTWHHVTVSSEPNGVMHPTFPHVGGAKLRWFLDGVQIAEDSGTGSTGPVVTNFTQQTPSEARVVVGVFYNYLTNVWSSCPDTLMSDVQVFPRALLAREVNQIFRAGPTDVQLNLEQ